MNRAKTPMVSPAKVAAAKLQSRVQPAKVTSPTAPAMPGPSAPSTLSQIQNQIQSRMQNRGSVQPKNMTPAPAGIEFKEDAPMPNPVFGTLDSSTFANAPSTVVNPAPNTTPSYLRDRGPAGAPAGFSTMSAAAPVTGSSAPSLPAGNISGSIGGASGAVPGFSPMNASGPMSSTPAAGGMRRGGSTSGKKSR